MEPKAKEIILLGIFVIKRNWVDYRLRIKFLASLVDRTCPQKAPTQTDWKAELLVP